MLGTYHLNGLFDILKEIHFIYDPEKMWNYVLEQACKILQAEAATFYLSTHEGKEMEVKSAYGVDASRLKQLQFKAGVGICGWVLQYQQPALVPDVAKDNRFNRAVDAVTGAHTVSILCVPVLAQQRIYGVIELVNRKSGQFGPQDQELMTVLGRQAAAAYQNLLLLEDVKHARTLLESILQNLSGGLIAVNHAGQVLILNPAASRMLQINDPSPIGKPANEIFKTVPWFVQTMEQTLVSKNTVSRQEIELPIAGTPSRIGYTTILISDPEKNILGSGIIFQQLK
jgi:adenylate cyclase